jgi:hypothetical protein
VQLNLIPYAEKEDYNSSQILKHNWIVEIETVYGI